MSNRDDFVAGFREGLRQAFSRSQGFRWVPATGVLLGGAIAIYVLSRLSGSQWEPSA